MANDECQVAEDGCAEGQSGEPMTEGSSGAVVGHDSIRVIDVSTNDKNGILSHEAAHAAGQPGQGDGVGQCLPDDAAARRTLAASPFPQWQARLRRSFTGGIF